MEWDIVVDSVKIKLAFTNRIPYATNLLNYSIVVTIFFIPTLTAYICSKSDWSHISSQIFRFAVFYPTQQGIQHTPDFSPLCFLFSKMKDNISSKQPLLTFHHYMSSIVVVAEWEAQNKKWAGVGFGYNWKCQKDVLLFETKSKNYFLHFWLYWMKPHLSTHLEYLFHH